MKKIISILVTAILATSILVIPASASWTQETIGVYNMQVWNYCDSIMRTKSYNYGLARAISVYPLNGGYDNFTKIQAAIMDTTYNNITSNNYVVLNENNTTSTKIYIKNGKLNTSYIRFAFRGNDPDYGAGAVVNYDPK